MQDREGLLGRQRKRSVERKCNKAKQSEGLKRVWRGKRSLKESSPERKNGWWERAQEGKDYKSK